MKTRVLISMSAELAKLCAVEDPPSSAPDEIERRKARLHNLKMSPLGEQGRAAALGAVAVPLMGTLGRAISGDSPKHLGRKLVAEAVSGAIGGGAVPLMRNRVERAVESNKIKALEKPHA